MLGSTEGSTLAHAWTTCVNNIEPRSSKILLPGLPNDSFDSEESLDLPYNKHTNKRVDLWYKMYGILCCIFYTAYTYQPDANTSHTRASRASFIRCPSWYLITENMNGIYAVVLSCAGVYSCQPDFFSLFYKIVCRQ